MRLIVAYDLMGYKSLSRILCFTAKYIRASGIVLLGNTASPTIVEWLSSNCRLRTLGVLGECDSPALAVALSRSGELLECKYTEYGGLSLIGVGLSGCHDLPERGVDVVFTSQPGFQYTCCHSGWDWVDRVIERVKPKLVIIGGCERPCLNLNKRVFSPGTVRLGFIGVVEYTEDTGLSQRYYNIEEILFNLLRRQPGNFA